MLAVEYSGLIDWIKEKTGIGYSVIKTVKDTQENRSKLKELQAIMKGKGINSYIKCSGGVCSLYVDTNRLEDVIRILDEYSKAPKVEQKDLTRNLIIGTLISIPLILFAGVKNE